MEFNQLRISHRVFEEIARNPRNWRNIVNQYSSFISMGYDGYTKLAIIKYHKTNSEIEAQNALSRYLSRFRNMDRISECEDVLTEYIQWHQLNNPIVIDIKRRINVDINYGNSIYGEITRVDFTPTGGYSGILLGNKADNWQSELRMPIIQFGLSQVYYRSVADFSVGVQNLDGSELETISFSSVDIKNALKKAESLSKNYLRG